MFLRAIVATPAEVEPLEKNGTGMDDLEICAY